MKINITITDEIVEIIPVIIKSIDGTSNAWRIRQGGFIKDAGYSWRINQGVQFYGDFDLGNISWEEVDETKEHSELLKRLVNLEKITIIK